MSSFSYNINHNKQNASSAAAAAAAAQNRNQQQTVSNEQQSPIPQRRESLVKPTWQNVCPGEVPFETLEKLNQLSNGEQQSILQQQQVTKKRRRKNAIHTTFIFSSLNRKEYVKSKCYTQKCNIPKRR